ncbi:TonB-dependent receptor [Vicingaceae bacterium]|nr:TonB-dependent receptor [Vicingaceae bacterium]MDB4060918.1 TonB-dependent receptor [Vicingaceae bacterium]MDC1450859.1 TonB-dependent receptor [Vicingaceae bacterium]
MKKLFTILFLTIPFFVQAQSELNGKVVDKITNNVLIGANIYIEGGFDATFTNKDGEFSLRRLRDKKVSLIVSYIGYKKDTIAVDISNKESFTFYLEPFSYQSDEVLVSSTRVAGNAPATKTNVSKEAIAKNNLGQDLPYLLQQTPSVVTSSDGGTGLGYTAIRIRGSDASRTNVTINGVPLNDPESHGVFWVNMPDFASSLNSVQIQRGVGTSTNGAGAFGATINLETKLLTTEAYGEISNSVGFLETNEEFGKLEYNNRKHTVQFGSGLFNNKFSFEGRLSNIQSEGYIDRATADLQSYFLSGTYYGKKTILKAITFGGKEVTYQSWNGTLESRVNNNREGMLTSAANNGLSASQTENLLNSGRTYNLYEYENQVDNYNQDHYQLHVAHEFNDKLTAKAALHYTKGYGYFEEFKEGEDLSDYGLQEVTVGNGTVESTDLIRRRWLDNDFYGMTYSLNYDATKKLNINFGGAINNYEGDHFGEVIWAEFASNSSPTENYYASASQKLDGNFYLKTNYLINKKVSLMADLQIRRINYTAKGNDNDLREIKINENYTFFNPKVGANYKIDANWNTYVFAGIGNREPNRSDFIDQAPNTPKKDANKTEKMYNVELGSEYKTNKYSMSANLYYMYYFDQLVATGQLNDVGSPLRQNVDRSFRRGIELQAGVKLVENLTWNVTATLSENKIENYNELLYAYDENFSLDSIYSFKLEDTDIAFSPNVIVTSELSYEPAKGVEIALLSRYIGSQYLDNTQFKGRRLDAYFINDLRLQAVVPQKLFKELKINVLINNILREQYSSNGYTYSYVYGIKVTENFVYPQALRNYMIGINLKF